MEEKKEETKELTLEMLTKYCEDNKELNLQLFTRSYLLAIKGILISKGLCTIEDFDELAKVSRDILIKQEFENMSEEDKTNLAKHIDNENVLNKFSSMLGFDITKLF